MLLHQSSVIHSTHTAVGLALPGHSPSVAHLIRAPGEDIRQSHISSSHINSNSESPSPGCKGRLHSPQEEGAQHLQGKHRPTRSLLQGTVSCKDGRDNSNGAFLFLLKLWMNWRRKTVRRQLNFLQSALKHTMFLILSIKSCRGS